MIFKPPSNIATRDFSKKNVFLAGSIEMGKAEDWQSYVGKIFSDNNWNVFNPRREDWDSTWVQDFNNPQFYQQVNWEADALEKSDLIIMYFSPGTQSPISLLELGRYSTTGKMLVICPEGFWRKGNVDIFCHKFNIPLFDSMEKCLNFVENKK